jgi:hypothetical protein
MCLVYDDSQLGASQPGEVGLIGRIFHRGGRLEAHEQDYGEVRHIQQEPNTHLGHDPTTLAGGTQAGVNLVLVTALVAILFVGEADT